MLGTLQSYVFPSTQQQIFKKQIEKKYLPAFPLSPCQEVVHTSARLRLMEHRQQRISEVRAKYQCLKKELEQTKQHLMLEPHKWTTECKMDADTSRMCVYVSVCLCECVSVTENCYSVARGNSLLPSKVADH